MCTDFEEFFRITCDLFPDAASWGFLIPSTSLKTTVEWLRQDEEKYLNMEEDGPTSLNGSTSTVPSSSEEESPSSAEVSPARQKPTPFEEKTNTEKSRKGDEEKKCVICSTTETTLWRYGARGLTKCNACYLYEIHNPGGSRPERLWGKEIGRRRRSAGKVKKKKKTSR